MSVKLSSIWAPDANGMYYQFDDKANTLYSLIAALLHSDHLGTVQTLRLQIWQTFDH